MTVRVINMFQNAQLQKLIFQELISLDLFEIETRGQVFCIALVPVTICVAIRLPDFYIYFIIHGDILTPEIVQRLDKLSKSVDSFGIRCGLGWVLGGLAGTISLWAVPDKTAKNTRKR